jgi:hypothetical protein
MLGIRFQWKIIEGLFGLVFVFNESFMDLMLAFHPELSQ